MCTLSHISELRKQAIFFEALKKFGIPKNQVVEVPDTFADRKPQEGESYYYYSGPNDDKTRKFCKRMLKIDKVFSTTDIDILSNYLDYDVLKYKGSYNLSLIHI